MVRALAATAAAAAVVLSGFVAPAAQAATTAAHEITVNWLGTPTTAPFGSTLTSEWHISTNDSVDPFANDPVDNVRATLTMTNGVFTSIPSVCKTADVVPVSSISPDGATLVCNVGTIVEGNATVIQVPTRVSGANGGNISAAGSVTSDSAVASAGPVSPTPLPITYVHGMDLSLNSAPGTGYQGGVLPSRTGGSRTFVQMNFSIILSAGSRPGPASYSFPLNVTGSVAGSMTGFQWEGCVPISTKSASSGQPFSDPAQADSTNFPTCSVSGSGANYTVTASNLNYTLVNTPTKDSLGTPLSGTGAYIASGTVRFSIPAAVTQITTYTFNANAAGPFTFTDGFVSPDVPGNNTSSVTLTPTGGFSNQWIGTPTYSRSAWDTNLWVSPGTSQNMPLPTPGIDTKEDFWAAIAAGTPALDLKLYMQANSSMWESYTGPGGAQMAGTCTMSQNPNFVVTHMDGGGYGAGEYVNYTTERYFYTTAILNTKTETCGQAAPSAMWTEVFPAAGTSLTDPRIASDSLITLPAGVTGIKMTWNPAVDRAGALGVTFLRGFGHISQTAPTTGEGWTVGAFNFPGANPWPQYPSLNGYSNLSTAPGGNNLPGSTYGPNMQGHRDAFRLQGPEGIITKAASDTTAKPGVPITYTITAQAKNNITSPPPASFPVVDTLPVGMAYVPGSASPAPSSVSPDGRTLTWNFTSVPANVFQTITYQAQTPPGSLLAPGATLTNTAVINVPGDQRPANTTGRTASATVTVPSSASTSLGKSADDNVLSFYGDTSAWNLVINSEDPVTNSFTDTIDKLPVVGDGRGTNIDGSYSITGVTAPTGSTIYYTTAPFASISTDPRVASNGGTPGSVAGNTVGWSTIPTANPTAIRVIAPALAPGASQVIRISFSTPAGTDCAVPAAGDNKPGQVLVNSASSFAGHTRLPMLSSATTTIGDCYALDLKKYVLVKGGDPADPADFRDADTSPDYPQYAAGDTVPFRIIVTNKGTSALTEIPVVDSIVPACSTTIPTLAAGASFVIDCSMTAAVGETLNTASATITPPDGPQLSVDDPAGFVVPEPYTIAKSVSPATGSPAEPGSVVEYTITVSEPDTSSAPYPNPSLSDDLSDILDDADYNGDVAVSASGGTATVSGNTLSWSHDAIMPGQEITITYSVTVKSPNTGNHILLNTVVPPPGITCGSSCVTINPVPGVVFTKTASTAVAHPGDVVTYTVTAENIGEVDYTAGYPASFTDDLTDVLLDASFNAGSETGGVTYSDPSIEWTGSLAAGATATFSYAVTILADGGDDVLDNTVVSTTPGNNCADSSTDPDCSAQVLVQSYTVEKATAETPVAAGDIVSYTITVTNTGAVPYTAANPASFSDDLTGILDEATYNNDVTGGAVYGAPTLSWSGALPVGASTSFTYSVTVTNPATGDDHLQNTVVPTALGGACAAAGACDTDTPIASFAVQKVAGVASATQGDTVHYTITVTNTGAVPFTAGFPASFNDSFTGVLDDGTLDGIENDGSVDPTSITSTAGATTYDAPTLHWEGPIAVGGTATIEYDVIIDDPTFGDHHLRNVITTPPGLANCSTGSVDPGCRTDTPIASYRVVKDASQTTVEVGDVVTYSLTVTNTGEVDYANVDISDDLTDVLLEADFVAGSESAGAVFDGVDTLTWSGPLAVGATVTITYQIAVTGGDDTDVDNAELVNTVTSTTPGGNCEPGSTDPACNFELPLKRYEVEKSASTTTAYPGDTVTYTITVENVGSVAYTAGDPATLTDDLSAVLDDAAVDEASLTSGMVYDDALEQITWAGALSVGQTIVLTYDVVIDNPVGGDNRLLNVVTTPPDSGGTCTDGASDPQCRADVLVQSFTVEKTADPAFTQPGESVVYTITVTNTGQVDYTTGPNAATFRDDLQDVLDNAAFGSVLVGDAIFDGTRYLDWSGPLPVGGTLVFRYSVTTLGAVALDGGDNLLTNVVEVPQGIGGECLDCTTDTPIRSLHISKSSTPSATSEGGVVEYTVTVENTGAVDYTAGSPAGFTDDLSQVLDDAEYNGDVAPASASVSGNVLSWSGALAAGASIDITYSVTVDDPDSGDHLLDNVVTSRPGTGANCVAGSGDPECETSTPVRSFHVTKSATPATTVPGATVTYTIVVVNDGAIAYTDPEPAAFSDDLTDVLDDAQFGEIVSGAGANYDGDVTLDWAGELAIGATATIVYTVVVDDPDAGDHQLVNDVVTPPGLGGNCLTGSGEPECSTVTPVQSYSVTKVVDKAVVLPGESVTYTVTVVNTGQVDFTVASPATFTDDLSQVLDDATFDSATPGAVYTDATQTLAWSGQLPIGESRVLTYTVIVDDPVTGDSVLTNAVLTPPGSGGSCEDPANPGCFTQTLVRSLHVQKTASMTTAAQGDLIVYTITVENTGAADFTAGTPASFTDNLSGVLDDATYQNDVDNGATYTAPTIQWSGALAAGDSITFTYSVRANNPDLGDHVLNNPVVTPPGLGSNCEAASVDPDCATSTPVRSLRVEKTANVTEFQPGDVVEYTITVTNTGAVDYVGPMPASFTDDLVGVLDDADYNGDASNGATVVDGVLSWTGEVPIGGVATITYTVTVHNPNTGDRVMYNRVVTPPELGANCSETSTDPSCDVNLGGRSLALLKTSSTELAFPGDVVDYEITLTNTGGIAFTADDPASFVDDLSAVLDDASYNGDATSNAIVAGDLLSWSGPLAVGDSVTIQYSVTVNAPASGDHIMDNVATTPAGIESNCETVLPGDPSDPVIPTDPDCATRTLVKSYSTVKTSNADASLATGDRVEYTIVVTNTGLVPYTDADPASFTDSFADVIDDATYNQDATDGASYTAPVLAWSGALEVGESRIVTYSVTVNSEGGNNRLYNAVVSAFDIGGSCDTSELGATCVVVTAIARPLALTGLAMQWTLIAATLLALFAAGAALMIVDRRRRRAVS